MIVYLKFYQKGEIQFSSFTDEESAYEEINTMDEDDVQLLVDISVVKHYRNRYFEIYSYLFHKLDDIDEFGSVQMLVDIEEILDYKEKYEDFYKLLINNVKEKGEF